MKKERATSRESQGGMLKKLSLLLLFSILTVMLLMPVSANAAPKLNKKTARIYVGKTVKLKVSGKKGKLKWKSANSSIASVSSSGVVRGKKPGKTTITVKLASGKTAKFTVKVQRTDVATTAVTVTNKATGRRLTGTVNLKLRKNLALGAVVTPLTSTQRVTYATSNSRIASVNSRGVVTARRTGTVTITVRSGRKIARIRVRVTRK